MDLNFEVLELLSKCMHENGLFKKQQVIYWRPIQNLFWITEHW
jgi:hypothetical protein